MSHCRPNLIAVVVALTCAKLAMAQSGQPPPAGVGNSADNGTDPTKLSSTIAVQHEHLALREGARSDTMKLTYTLPLGEQRNASVRFRVPIARVETPGLGDHTGLGDASIQFSRVFGLTSAHGFVAQGEWVFDTARRAELGSGKSVLKGTLVWALFLEGGNIFAPAVVHSQSVAGRANRARVNTTTLDFYCVPKLADAQTFVTIDPALSFDWENGKHYPSLAVTVGRALGPALGGNAQVFVKPTVFAGGERPGDWGLEVGVKVIGF